MDELKGSSDEEEDEEKESVRSDTEVREGCVCGVPLVG